MNCTTYVAKIKALISFAVTAKLICAFVFAYAKTGFLTTRLIYSRPEVIKRFFHASSQAKGTKSTSFLAQGTNWT